MSFKDRLNKSNPKHDKPPMERPIIKTRARPDLYKPSWGDFTISNPGLEGASSTTITSTGSQTYTVARGVDTLTVTMYGGGGGGGPAASAGRGGGTNNGFGGGSSAKCVYKLNEVRPGSVITFSVGAGGPAGTGSSPGDWSNGGDTTLTHDGTTYTAGGGMGGSRAGCFGGAPICQTGGGGQSTNGSVSNTSGATAGLGLAVGAGGASVGDSAGAGGSGSHDHILQNNQAGGDGKVIIG